MSIRLPIPPCSTLSVVAVCVPFPRWSPDRRDPTTGTFFENVNPRQKDRTFRGRNKTRTERWIIQPLILILTVLSTLTTAEHVHENHTSFEREYTHVPIARTQQKHEKTHRYIPGRRYAHTTHRAVHYTTDTNPNSSPNCTAREDSLSGFWWTVIVEVNYGSRHNPSYGSATWTCYLCTYCRWPVEVPYDTLASELERPSSRWERCTSYGELHTLYRRFANLLPVWPLCDRMDIDATVTNASPSDKRTPEEAGGGAQKKQNTGTPANQTQLVQCGPDLKVITVQEGKETATTVRIRFTANGRPQLSNDDAKKLTARELRQVLIKPVDQIARRASAQYVGDECATEAYPAINQLTDTDQDHVNITGQTEFEASPEDPGENIHHVCLSARSSTQTVENIAHLMLHGYRNVAAETEIAALEDKIYAHFTKQGFRPARVRLIRNYTFRPVATVEVTFKEAQVSQTWTAILNPDSLPELPLYHRTESDRVGRPLATVCVNRDKGTTYVRTNCTAKITCLPTETAQDIIQHWGDAVAAGETALELWSVSKYREEDDSATITGLSSALCSLTHITLGGVPRRVWTRKAGGGADAASGRNPQSYASGEIFLCNCPGERTAEAWGISTTELWDLAVDAFEFKYGPVIPYPANSTRDAGRYDPYHQLRFGRSPTAGLKVKVEPAVFEQHFISNGRSNIQSIIVQPPAGSGAKEVEILPQPTRGAYAEWKESQQQAGGIQGGRAPGGLTQRDMVRAVTQAVQDPGNMHGVLASQAKLQKQLETLADTVKQQASALAQSVETGFQATERRDGLLMTQSNKIQANMHTTHLSLQTGFQQAEHLARTHHKETLSFSAKGFQSIATEMSKFIAHQSGQAEGTTHMEVAPTTPAPGLMFGQAMHTPPPSMVRTPYATVTYKCLPLAGWTPVAESWTVNVYVDTVLRTPDVDTRARHRGPSTPDRCSGSSEINGLVRHRVVAILVLLLLLAIEHTPADVASSIMIFIHRIWWAHATCEVVHPPPVLYVTHTSLYQRWNGVVRVRARPPLHRKKKWKNYSATRRPRNTISFLRWAIKTYAELFSGHSPVAEGERGKVAETLATVVKRVRAHVTFTSALFFYLLCTTAHLTTLPRVWWSSKPTSRATSCMQSVPNAASKCAEVGRAWTRALRTVRTVCTYKKWVGYHSTKRPVLSKAQVRRVAQRRMGMGCGEPAPQVGGGDDHSAANLETAGRYMGVHTTVDCGQSSWLFHAQLISLMQVHGGSEAVHIPLQHSALDTVGWIDVWTRMVTSARRVAEGGAQAGRVLGTNQRIAEDLLRRQIRGQSGVYTQHIPGHWRVLIVSHVLREVLLFDPFGTPFSDRETHHIERAWQEYRVCDMQTKVQTDGYNCGVWVAWAAGAWLTHVQEGREGSMSIRSVLEVCMQHAGIAAVSPRARLTPTQAEHNENHINAARAAYSEALNGPLPARFHDWLRDEGYTMDEVMRGPILQSGPVRRARRTYRNTGHDRDHSIRLSDSDEGEVGDAQTAEGTRRTDKGKRPMNTLEDAPRTRPRSASPQLPSLAGTPARTHKTLHTKRTNASVGKQRPARKRSPKPLSQRCVTPDLERTCTRGHCDGPRTNWNASYEHDGNAYRHFHIVTWNVGGIGPRNVLVDGESELTHTVAETSADILLLQETHYKAWTRYRIHLPGFTQYHSSIPKGTTRTNKDVPLPDHQRGMAGVSTLVRDTLDPATRVTRLQEPAELRGYLLALRVHTARGDIVILNTYVPPEGQRRTRVLDLLCEWLATQIPVGEPILIGGDFNAAWMTYDKPLGRLTSQDTSYQRRMRALGLLPTDTWRAGTHRVHTYETHHATESSGDTSRIDDFLFSTDTGMRISPAVFPRLTKVYQDSAHTSDHHPLGLRVDGRHIPFYTATPAKDTVQTPNVEVRRIKQRVSVDMIDSLRNTLSDRLYAEISALRNAVDEASQSEHANGTSIVAELSTAVDTILTAAWEITLQEIGETVTIGPRHPIPRRRHQRGHLRNTDKKRMRILRTHTRSVRRAARSVDKKDPTPEQAEHIGELLNKSFPADVSSAHIRQELLEALRESKRNITHLLRTHDRKGRLATLRRKQQLLRDNPRKAHRYIFESGERKPLDHVRLSTGEVVTTPEGVIDEVTKVYRNRLRPTVPAEGAGRYPWEGQRTTPLIPNSGGTHATLGHRYNVHIFRDCLSKLPNKKAPGPDGVPNEVIKNMPEEFHDSIHGLFELMWKYRCTPTQWKDDNTVLLYKKGDPGGVQNHRPIGLKRTIYRSLWTATVTRILTG